MNAMKKIAAFLIAALLASAALAQTHDSGAGGGVNMNMTAGTVNCQLSGTGGCSIVPNSLYGITGTTTNDSANGGSVGEVLQATVVAGSAVSLTTATAANITTLVLTAGDWEVYGACDRTWTGVTATILVCGIGTVTATQPTQPGGTTGTVTIGTEPLVSQSMTYGTTVTGRFDQRVQTSVKVAAGGGSIFLVATDTFSAGTNVGFGTLRARRIR